MPRELFDGQLPDSEMARRSMIIVPMMARERTIGAMIFVSAGREQAYNSMDLVISEDLAHRAAFAIENARLYEEAQRAIRARELPVEPLHTRAQTKMRACMKRLN